MELQRQIDDDHVEVRYQLMSPNYEVPSASVLDSFMADLQEAHTHHHLRIPYLLFLRAFHQISGTNLMTSDSRRMGCVLNQNILDFRWNAVLFIDRIVVVWILYFDMSYSFCFLV